MRPASAIASAPTDGADDDAAAADQQRLRDDRSGVGAPLWLSAGRISANSSAAAPSLNRLSLSMTSRRRPLTPASRSMAMTAIGSVAAISAPKASAGASGQLEPPDESGRDDRRADQHADGRQRQHRREIALEFAPRDAERRLEQQRRQDDLEQDVVGQRQSSVQARQRERQSGRHQADRVGQAQRRATIATAMATPSSSIPEAMTRSIEPL